MKARLTHSAAPWLIVFALLAGAPAHAQPSAAHLPSAITAPVRPANQVQSLSPRLVWDRVGAPMQVLA